MNPTKLLAFASVALSVACTTADPVRIPNGDKGFAVHCGDRLDDCYDEARRQCPDGEFVVLGTSQPVVTTAAGPEPVTDDRHEMLVDCRRSRPH